MKNLHFGFIGKHQMDLLLVWREYYNPMYAEVVFSIRTPRWIQKLVWERLGWADYERF